MAKDQENIDIGDFIKFIKDNNALLWVFVVLVVVIITFFLGIGFSYEERARKLHPELIQNGMVVYAVSCRDNCSK